jgi:hypothetical protein
VDPGHIQRWLDGNLWKLDGPEAYLGDEPGSVRKPWDQASVRMLLAASWPYMQAAGNNSTPVVYRCVNDSPGALCDRFYLPATPRDFRLLERAGLPVFGIETKHGVQDFDVFATSISYTVLWLNFCQYLRVSGIPLRWRDRLGDPGAYPMVMAGGQAWSHPEFMAPVVDCVFLGEAEDAPGNPGISVVMEAIADMKADGLWRAERSMCYRMLAVEFPFLYFPREVEFGYRYEDRGLPEPTKLVSGWSGPTALGGPAVRFKKRYVKDLDSAAPHTQAPLLYSDPGMGAGDIEAGKGCPAWCSFPLIGETQVLSREWGISSIDWLHGVGKAEVWDGAAWASATVESHGVQAVQRITFRPADCGTANGAWRRNPKATHRVQVTATAAHGWELVDGTETHALRAGDFVPAAAASVQYDGSSYDLGRVHGFLFGDGHQRKLSTGERRPVLSGSFKVRLFGKDAAVRPWFEKFWQPDQDDRDSWAVRPDLRVSSIQNPDYAKGDVVVYGWAAFDVKSWPSPAVDTAYVAGFLEGWLAADGTLRAKETSYVLAAQYSAQHHGDTSPSQWLERHAAQGGWVYVGCCQSRSDVTNFGPRSAPLMQHTLVKPERHGWCVEAIEPLDKPQEVYCLTVPGSHRFSLADGVFTMNCHLTYVDKPYREHSVEYLIEQARQWRLNMGSNELSPYGPDFPMYTRKKELLGGLLEQVSDEVDTGAMRVDDFIGDPDYSMLLAFGGTDAVTLGLEGNSQRMRDLIGKGVSDQDVEEAVTRAIRAGIRKVKLFMISNMPGEEAGDVMRIVRLGQRLAEIREQLGQPGVRIQFSWTPLLIEAQTPMQWFAPTAPDYTLQQAMADLRDQRIEMKLGSKAQPEKIALFQACQRASRDAGEAITDVIEDLAAGCWGGVAKDMKDRLNAALKNHGFRNGLDDLFLEMGEDDLFGWEHIDTGVSKQLMWGAYRHMVQFLEGTDSESYDEQFDESYRGSEWIARCDQHCSGNTCGCCDKTDLKIRQGYLKATDRDLEARPVRPLDQTTVACKVRFRYERSEKHRFVSNAHWKFAIRRAAYRAQEHTEGFPPIAKRSVRIVSDAYKFRDRSAGTDYAEFGLTRQPHKMNNFIAWFKAELDPWLALQSWMLYPKESQLPATPKSFWELEVAGGEQALAAALRAYDEAPEVRVLLKQESFYSGMSAEEANAKDHIADAWLVRDADRLLLRMILNGKLGPYQAYAPLCGKKSWVDAMRYTARRLAFFDGADPLQGSLLRPVCIGCGTAVPAGLLGEVFDMDYCPRCRDELGASGFAVGLSRLV